MDDGLARLQHPLDIAHSVLPSPPPPNPLTPRISARPRGAATLPIPPLRCNTREGGRTNTRMPNIRMSDGHAAPQAARHAAIDRGGEPRGEALGRDGQRLVHRPDAELGAGVLVSRARAGDGFCRRRRAGCLGGAAAEAGVCLAYRVTARNAGWPRSVGAGTAGFAACAAFLQVTDLPLWLLAPILYAALASALWLMPPLARRARPIAEAAILGSAGAHDRRDGSRS